MTADGTQAINERQDDPDNLDLLYAADVMHQRAQRAEAARGLFVMVIAAMGIVASTWRGAADAVAITGVFVAAGTEFLWPLISRRATHTATLAQEAFDTAVFGLPWPTKFGSALPRATVVKLARRYQRTGEKRGWYVDVRGLPRALAVMICQRQNLMWDADLRYLWATRLMASLGVWLAAGGALALVADWTVRDLVVRWLAPSLAAILYAARLSAAHWSLAVRKSHMRQELDAQLARLSVAAAIETQQELLNACRERQDAIFTLRDRAERVPQRLYDSHRTEDEEAHARDAASVRNRLLADTTQPERTDGAQT